MRVVIEIFRDLATVLESALTSVAKRDYVSTVARSIELAVAPAMRMAGPRLYSSCGRRERWYITSNRILRCPTATVDITLRIRDTPAISARKNSRRSIRRDRRPSAHMSRGNRGFCPRQYYFSDAPRDDRGGRSDYRSGQETSGGPYRNGAKRHRARLLVATRPHIVGAIIGRMGPRPAFRGGWRRCVVLSGRAFRLGGHLPIS